MKRSYFKTQSHSAHNESVHNIYDVQMKPMLNVPVVLQSKIRRKNITKSETKPKKLTKLPTLELHNEAML